MRWRAMWTSVLAVSCALAAAPEASAQSVLIGVKGGVNVADATVDGEDIGSRTAFVGGAFASIGLGPIWGIRPELLFSQRGASNDSEGPDEAIELQLNYIEFPLLLEAGIPTVGPIDPVLFAGPTIAFELGCDLVPDSGSEVECEQGIEDELLTSDTDFGLAFGGGVRMGGGKVRFVLDGRYTLGLTDLNEGDPSELKSRTWSVMAGLGLQVP